MASVLVGRLTEVEAQVVRLALEAAGVDVELRGEARTVMAGLVPPGDAVEVWVDEAASARARAVLAELEHEQKAPPRERPPVFAVIFGVTSVVLAVLLVQERQQPRVRDGVVAWREEGHCMSAYRGAVRLSRLCDRNDDGNFENQETFDAKNRLSSVCSDSDEDGTCDQITQLDAAGKVISRSFDERHEGRMSRTVAYDSFEHTRERGFDDDGDGRVERSEFFDQRGERQGVAAHRDQPTWEARWFVDGGEIVEHAPQDGGLREMRFEQGGRVVRVQALEATGWVDVN